MEKNPLELPEEEYAAKREQLFLTLTERQKASFALLENQSKLAQETGEKRHQFAWDRALGPSYILEMALNGGKDILPTPDFNTYDLDHKYEVFFWNVKDLSGRVIDVQQMRLWFLRDEMHIRGNVALRLGNYKNEVEKMVGQIPYPTLVFTDGFRYENQAFIDKRNKT